MIGLYGDDRITALIPHYKSIAELHVVDCTTVMVNNFVLSYVLAWVRSAII